MDLRLAGKRALVTGSSSGIGEAIAEAIRAEGGTAEVALGDLTTDAGADVVAAAALAGGPLDILVNNAGVFSTADSRLPGQLSC